MPGLKAEKSYPDKVYVGLYLNDISGFDTKEGRFRADLFMWVKWLGDSTVPHISIFNGEIDHQEIILQESDNNWHSVRWRVQGTFRGNFPLQDFPFDNQTIRLEVDLPAEWGELIPDQAASGMSKEFSITGWNYEPYFHVKKESTTFSSDLGSIDHEGIEQKMNRLTFSLKLSRPLAANFVKLIVPLLIIIMMATMAFFLQPDQLVVRNGTVVTALLSCVAFHFSQSQSLPDVSYLVAADKFFLWAYLLILLALIGVVSTFRLFKKGGKYVSLASKVDRGFYIMIPTLAIVIGMNVKITHEVKKVQEPIAIAQRDSSIISSQDMLTKAVPVLPSITEENQHLFMRGLYIVTAGGRKEPHLVQKVPDMTNDYVRFLANGGVAVKWKIRKDIHWGDGTPITIDDVIFSLKMFDDSNRVEIKRLDNETIEVVYQKRLNDVISSFPVYPQHLFEPIYKKGGLDSVHHVLAHTPPPMDGPYILKEFVPEKHALFIRNKHFPGQAPYIEKIKIAVNKDGERWLSPKEILEQDKADLISLMSKGSHHSVEDIEGYTIQIDSTSNNVFFLQPDISAPPFDDVRVRQGISYALDRERIAMAIDDGAGELTTGSYLGQLDNPNIQRYDYDIDKAISLIKEAGAYGKRIELKGYSRGEGAPEQVIMDIVKENLEQVGFNVVFTPLEKHALSQLQNRDHGGLLYYEGQKDDIGIFWNVPYDHEHHYFDMEHAVAMFDEKDIRIYEKYEASMFEERRQSLLEKLQADYSQKLPTIPLFSISFRSVHKDNLVGWQPMAADSKNIWWNVEDWYFEPQEK